MVSGTSSLSYGLQGQVPIYRLFFGDFISFLSASAGRKSSLPGAFQKAETHISHMENLVETRASKRQSPSLLSFLKWFKAQLSVVTRTKSSCRLNSVFVRHRVVYCSPHLPEFSQLTKTEGIQQFSRDGKLPKAPTPLPPTRTKSVCARLQKS